MIFESALMYFLCTPCSIYFRMLVSHNVSNDVANFGGYHGLWKGGWTWGSFADASPFLRPIPSSSGGIWNPYPRALLWFLLGYDLFSA